MKALGAIPVMIRLHERTVTTTIYIFEQVTGVLLSWKASRDLGILPASYPVPPVHAEVSNQQVNTTSTQVDVSAETLVVVVLLGNPTGLSWPNNWDSEIFLQLLPESVQRRS